MEIALIILAFLALLVGILGAFIPVLPGPPLSYLGILLLHFTKRVDFPLAFLIFLAVVTIAVTLIDYLLPSYITKKFGGSKAASVGSFLGLIAGMVFFSPWGIIFGPFFGALIGQIIHRKRNVDDLEKSGKPFVVALGAFLAFIMGTGIKLITSVGMLVSAVKAVF